MPLLQKIVTIATVVLVLAASLLIGGMQLLALVGLYDSGITWGVLLFLVWTAIGTAVAAIINRRRTFGLLTFQATLWWCGATVIAAIIFNVIGAVAGVMLVEYLGG